MRKASLMLRILKQPHQRLRSFSYCTTPHTKGGEQGFTAPRINPNTPLWCRLCRIFMLQKQLEKWLDWQKEIPWSPGASCIFQPWLNLASTALLERALGSEIIINTVVFRTLILEAENCWACSTSRLSPFLPKNKVPPFHILNSEPVSREGKWVFSRISHTSYSASNFFLEISNHLSSQVRGPSVNSIRWMISCDQLTCVGYAITRWAIYRETGGPRQQPLSCKTIHKFYPTPPS